MWNRHGQGRNSLVADARDSRDGLMPDAASNLQTICNGSPLTAGWSPPRPSHWLVPLQAAHKAPGWTLDETMKEPSA